MAEGVQANIRVGIDGSAAKAGAEVVRHSLKQIRDDAALTAKAFAAIPGMGTGPTPRPSSRPSSPGGSSGTDAAMRAQIAATKALEQAETRRYQTALRIGRQMQGDVTLLARNSAATQALTEAIKRNGTSSEATAKAWGNFRREQAAISSDIAKNSGLFVKLDTQTQAITGSVNSLAARFKAARPAVQNFSYQIQDIAVQLAGGQSLFLVLGQQLPQLLGGFGLLGAAVGAAVAVFGGLATALFGSSDAAKDADESLKRFNDTVTDSVRLADAAAGGYTSLVNKLKEVSEAQRLGFAAQLRQELNKVNDELDAAVADVSEKSAQLFDVIYNPDILSYDRYAQVERDLSDLYRAIDANPADPSKWNDLAAALRGYSAELGPASKQALDLADAADISGAKAEAVNRKTQDLSAQLNVATGAAGGAATAITAVGSSADGAAGGVDRMAGSVDNLALSFSKLRVGNALSQPGSLIKFDPKGGESPVIPDRPGVLGQTFQGVEPSSLESNAQADKMLNALAGTLGKTGSAGKSAASAVQRVGNAYRDSLDDLRASLAEQNKLNTALASNDNSSAGLSQSVELLGQKLKISSKFTGDQRAELENLTEELFKAKKAGDAWSNVVNLRDANSLLEKQIELAGDSSVSAKKSLELFKTEQSLRRDGVDLQSEVGKATLDETARQSDLNAQLTAQTSIYEEISSIGSQAFDRIGEAITQAFTTGKGAAIDFGSIAMGAISELGQAVTKLGLINPVKNWLSGSNLPTLGDIGGTGIGSGSLGGLSKWLFGTAGSYPAPGAQGPIMPATSGAVGNSGHLFGME